MTNTHSETKQTADLSNSEHSVAVCASANAQGSRRHFFLCLGIVTAALIFSILMPHAQVRQPPQATANNQDVHLEALGKIYIKPDGPLFKKLQIINVQTQKVSTPTLTVSGAVVASLRAGSDKSKTGWQFSSPELLTTYTDWQKAVADVAFAKTQLEKIKQLADTKVSSQNAVAARLKKLVEAGAESEKDFAAAQAELLQAQIQGSKDVHEAETALRLAQRNEEALGRQLQQAGIDQEILRVTTPDVDIIVAEVPEALASRVALGQRCEAKFFSVPKEQFSGTVRAISPVLSKDRRSLRVQFAIHDPQDLLRAGMFGDIGLGTDEREALIVPMTGVVHVGGADFMLARRGHENWRIVEVQVGEAQQGAMEILRGLEVGEEVIGHGAILLKPMIVEALQKKVSAKSGGA